MGGDDYHRRTAITRLEVSPTDEPILRETVDAWQRGCQIAADTGWGREVSKRGLQQLAYDEIREETDLCSQHAILATQQAASNIKTCRRRRENGLNASKPTYTSPTVLYDDRTMTVFRDEEAVSLATTDNRVRCDLVLPDADDGYQQQYLDDDAWELTQSTLHYRDGEWFLHLGFRKPADADAREATENGTVLGVDLGVNQIAVTSTARFFPAGHLNHERCEYERTREQLQECGTRSAFRTLSSVSGREKRRAEDALHSVAKAIVDEAIRYDCDGIAFEELDGIRERLPGADWHSRWAFDRLFEYVEYKAEAEGLFVATVNPAVTSRRCADCGFISDENRSGRSFECRSCGNRNHADYNAAKNVAAAYLRREHQSSGRRGAGQYALKSGTVTSNGTFHPYPDGFETESTDNASP